MSACLLTPNYGRITAAQRTEGTTVGPDPKQLERPNWSALTTTHASFALGNDLARRYPPDISPMAAVRDVSEDPCLQSLTKLLAPGDVVGLFSTEQVLTDQKVPRHGFEAGPVHVLGELVVIETFCLCHRLRQHLAIEATAIAPD